MVGGISGRHVMLWNGGVLFASQPALGDEDDFGMKHFAADHRSALR